MQLTSMEEEPLVVQEASTLMDTTTALWMAAPCQGFLSGSPVNSIWSPWQCSVFSFPPAGNASSAMVILEASPQTEALTRPVQPAKAPEAMLSVPSRTTTWVSFSHVANAFFPMLFTLSESWRVARILHPTKAFSLISVAAGVFESLPKVTRVRFGQVANAWKPTVFIVAGMSTLVRTFPANTLSAIAVTFFPSCSLGITTAFVVLLYPVTVHSAPFRVSVTPFTAAVVAPEVSAADAPTVSAATAAASKSTLQTQRLIFRSS